MGKPTSVKDVDQHEIVDAISTFLKKGGKIKVPEWADLVKLGTNKELAPINPDWYYVRVASIARRLYIRSPAGIFFKFFCLEIKIFKVLGLSAKFMEGISVVVFGQTILCWHLALLYANLFNRWKQLSGWRKMHVVDEN